VSSDPHVAALALKHVDRAGWTRVRTDAVESVAAHSWGMALLALRHCPPALDRAEVLALCILHDIAEAIVGDITPHDGVSADEKRRREDAAAAALLGDAPELLRLFRDYAERRTPDARFVRQLDKLDMALQAGIYAEEGAETAEFVESARRGISDPALAALLPR
jgi:putative hydrolase of HD superfamily